LHRLAGTDGPVTLSIWAVLPSLFG